jgi:hypothetical protein
MKYRMYTVPSRRALGADPLSSHEAVLPRVLQDMHGHAGAPFGAVPRVR